MPPVDRAVGRNRLVVGSGSRVQIQQYKLQERDPVTDTSTGSEPAPVLDYLEWEKKMGKKRNGNHKDKKSSEGKTERELFFELTKIIWKRQFNSEQLYKLLEFADKISSKPDSKSDKD
jgi:hypothetical protein